MSKYKYWSKEEEEVMKKEYGNTLCRELAKRFGRSVKAVEKKAARMGLRSKISNGAMYANPHNRGIIWKPKELHHNWRKVGKPWVANGKVYYKPHRLSEPILYRRWIMEQQGYDIKGKVVRHKDGNPLNCKIENLEVLTRAEHVSKNSITRFPAELRKLIHLNSKLKKQISNAKK